jgi:YidC/Oxa1 family membrane protein insertase
MFSFLWNTLLYKPLINALAFLVSVLPGGDVGLAVILLTILVKLILFPLSERQIKNQAAMNILAPELEKIKKSGASKEEQARLTFELYKKHKTNPLSGCLIQIPVILVIIALYRVFIKGVDFDPSLLYSFVHAPTHVNMIFLGFIDLSQKSFILALLAAVSQYFQVYFMPAPAATTKNNSDDSFQANFSKSMYANMKYGFPILIFVILYTNFLGVSLSAAVALYWITSNIFTIGQQIYVNKNEPKELAAEEAVLSAEK